MKEPGHADSYPKLSINYVQSHLPTAIYYDDKDQMVEVLQLDEGYTTDDVHKLMQERCLTRKVKSEEGIQVPALPQGQPTDAAAQKQDAAQQVDAQLLNGLLVERHALAHLQPQIPHTIALLDQTIAAMQGTQQIQQV